MLDAHKVSCLLRVILGEKRIREKFCWCEKWSQSDMEQVTDSEVVSRPLPGCAGTLTDGFDWPKTESVTNSARIY